eukprot:scaffold1606_cov184-Skeletonema_dohrnii-CCMP3373.AAC.6
MHAMSHFYRNIDCVAFQISSSVISSALSTDLKPYGPLITISTEPPTPSKLLYFGHARWSFYLLTGRSTSPILFLYGLSFTASSADLILIPGYLLCQPSTLASLFAFL